MAKLALIELTEWLQNMRVVPHNGFCDELQDTGMHLIFLKIFLELMVCAFEDYLLFNEGSSTIEALLSSLVVDQMLMLSHL